VYDLLLDPINTVFAVNCEKTETTLRVGAVYMEPLLTTTLVTLSDGTDRITIVLPPELLNRSKPLSAWQVEFPLYSPTP
jgi:hypothetical protein